MCQQIHTLFGTLGAVLFMLLQTTRAWLRKRFIMLPLALSAVWTFAPAAYGKKTRPTQWQASPREIPCRTGVVAACQETRGLFEILATALFMSQKCTLLVLCITLPIAINAVKTSARPASGNKTVEMQKPATMTGLPCQIGVA